MAVDSPGSVGRVPFIDDKKQVATMSITPEKSTAHEWPASPRRWLQFRLRTLMLAMLILPIGLGWLAQARSKSQKAWENVAAIHKFGNTFDVWDRYTNPWWQRALGIDLPVDITELMIELHDIDEQKQAQALTHLQAFPHLKKLDIVNPCRTAAALGPLTHFQELEELTLLAGQSALFEDDISAMAKLPRLKIYHDLGYGLAHNAVDVLSSMASLEELSFSANDGNANLSRLKNLRRLNVSDLYLTMLISSGAGSISLPQVDNTIAEIATLENLESLKLERIDCSDEGLKPLTQLKNLKHLLVESNHLTDVGLATLAEMPSLETLDITSNKITPEAIAKLKAVRPQLKINGL